MDLFLNHQINAFGSIVLIITTQCLGYGMAGVLRKYLVYPAEMVWWGNLVQVVFYNAMHNTDEFKSKRMFRGWSYMKYFWVVCGAMFIYEFIPQYIAPLLVFFDWVCWFRPFDYNFWALFSSYGGGGAGILSLCFDWTAIGGATMWLPLVTLLTQCGGIILSYWIIFPIIWLNNVFNAKLYGRPLTSGLYTLDGKLFKITSLLNEDYSINEEKYLAGQPATMTPMYALVFMYSFIALTGCMSHIACFHGADIWKTWKQSRNSADEDIHVKMMKAYPEVPQLWYAAFYVVMVGLSCMVCEVYGLQLPWWGLLVALALSWVLTLPIGAMVAITGIGPGLNVITELVCGFMLPGKPIANMAFKCYGYMAMYQCHTLLADLKLGLYMKIAPRSMFAAQIWGAFIGSIFNYLAMHVIINARRGYLDGTKEDPSGIWTGVNPQIFWGSALIYGALGPVKVFGPSSYYNFIYWGFLIGAVIPVVQWGLSKKFTNIRWSCFNIAVFAGGMSGYPGGQPIGVLPCIILCIVWQFWVFRYKKDLWSKYTFILSAALDTGAAFTGLFFFVFLQGGISPKLNFSFPSWFLNHYDEDGNAPYKSVDRCGAFGNKWESGMLPTPPK
jgi:OPT family small oligopeptide transporter